MSDLTHPEHFNPCRDIAEIRRVKAECWDEGYIAGHEDARAVQPTYPQPTPNPYADEIEEERR